MCTGSIRPADDTPDRESGQKHGIVMRRSIRPSLHCPREHPHELTMTRPSDDLRVELAATAARLIAEEGCDYGQAKRRAVHEVLGSSDRRGVIPENSEVERELRRYLQLFESETHPRLLAGLRTLAAETMERLTEFDPHLVGAVLNGTATRHSDIHLQLFVDSAKDVEVHLMNSGIEFDVDGGDPDERPAALERLSFVVPAPRSAELQAQPRQIGVQLHVYARDAIRVAPRHRDRTDTPDLHPVAAAGRANLGALRRLIEDAEK